MTEQGTTKDLSRRERGDMVRLGPCIVPTYSVKAFSRFPPEIDFMDVWRLVGPTVQRNIGAPLWMQFCAVYLEGMNHAAGTINGDA